MKSGMKIISVMMAVAAIPLIAVGYSPQRASQTQGGPAFRDDGQLVFLKESTNAAIRMIQIEIADNDAERTQGLMYRHYMPENDGMLFIFGKEEVQAFWMKNTFIPLDMVFADKSGKIVSIYPDAQPLTETTITSGKPAKYVVEVNGGFCAANGVDVGDKIVYER